MHGVVNLDKPGGISSARAVARVKRLLPRGTKIGHAGTLDPFATGVLLLLIGSATKACERLMDEPKQYEATVKLGATTATDDPDSPECPNDGATAPTLQAVTDAVVQFIGNIGQRPPAYSAIKIGGLRASDLARTGKQVHLAVRTVRIDAIEILEFNWPLLGLRVDCGRGTYIRSIARDLGAALGTGGYLTQLRRTRVGGFDAGSMVSLERLESDGVTAHLQPVEQMPRRLEPR